jgi:hypothetical protein
MTEPVSGSELSDVKSELSGLIEAAGLNGTFDDETLSALAVLQARLQGRIGELTALLGHVTWAEEAISPRIYRRTRPGSGGDISIG